MTSIPEVFAPRGLLAETLPGFSFRAPQAEMAELVGRALDENRHAVLEAGTGIGKTFAYVVPVLLAGQRAIVSTGTKTLQDQLFARDLPSLGSALGRPVEVALLKGRGNYLCWHRLETARLDGRLDRAVQQTVDALATWARTSDSGDLTELDDIAEDYALRAHVSSTVDNCLGQRCEHYERCFVTKARRRAMAARVVIVNHHLLLADMVLRESGFGELLPGADAVIVDEAHLLPEIAQQFFAVSVSSRQLEMLGRDIVAEARVAGSDARLEQSAHDLMRAAAGVRGALGQLAGRVPWQGAPPGFRERLAALASPLAGLASQLEPFDGEAGLARCRERCVAALERLGTVTATEPNDGLRWVEQSESGFAAHWTPLDIGAALRERIDAQGGHWIFTSATLAVGQDFGHFLARVGVHDALEAVLPSPFDYAANARVYLPAGLPEPRDPRHTDALMASVWPLVEAAEGGAFLLFTSYRALNAAERWITRRRAPGPVLVQGKGARSQLLQSFRESGTAVLLGTSSFWQGVDVRGHALRLVVIDKLPFAVPGDPVVQAQIEAIRLAGGDPFRDFQLPEAILTLKQGVGRLIRDFGDRGMIVLGDPRLASRGYGRLVLDSLPPMPRITSPEDALGFAATLADGSAWRAAYHEPAAADSLGPP